METERRILAWIIALSGIASGSYVLVMLIGWGFLALQTTDPYLHQDDFVQSLAQTALVAGQLLCVAIAMGSVWLALKIAPEDHSR